MAATIDIEKAEATQSTPKNNNHSDRMQEMEASLKRFFERLDRSSEKFVPADAFDELLRYINNYDRVLVMEQKILQVPFYRIWMA